MRAVVDTNVSFGALMDQNSAPGRVLQAWRDGRFVLVLSPPMLSELRGVLRWHKGVRQFLAEVEAQAEIVDPPQVVNISTISPGDNRVVEAAVAAGADYVVTNDRALLALREFESIPIVTPSRFLRILNEAASKPSAATSGHTTEGSEGSGDGP